MKTEQYKGNRKAVTDYILSIIQEIDPTGTNKAIKEQELGKMSDKDFAAFMDDLESEGDFLRMFFAVGGKADVEVARNFAIGEKHFDWDFEQQLIMGSSDPDTPTILTPMKYIVMDVPFRRQSQTLISGISVAEHHNTVDQRTGAVTGDSAAAKCSGPEIGLYRAMGMTETLAELIKLRGGDEGAARAMDAQFMQTGEASIEVAKRFATGVGAVKAESAMLNAMHLANTL